ncbi:MAG: pyruvate kinase [Nitrospira sp.]|nr:pyruvate kinase [Nitrospira sp.]
MRKAKIVCTIGPATASPALLDRLIESGMDAARLNFSHGTYETHAAAIAAIRQAAARRKVSVAIIQDVQGPRVRVGKVAEGGIHVHAGQAIRLRPTSRASALLAASDPSVPDIPILYPSLTHDLKPGARILINDGLIELRADRIDDTHVDCTVVTGGTILSHKGINLPGTAVSVPTLTDKDRDDLRFGIAQGVDYVALSFVRGPDDLITARTFIAECGGDQPIIAKIERAEAVASLDTILDQADGVMIARGDLGVEMGPEAVPILQKRIIAKANQRRRLVITATQMLESMTQSPRPTRAEASDVANAVFDGTDAVMLSAETAIGAYPLETVQVMDRIIQAAEREVEPMTLLRQRNEGPPLPFPDAVCTAAYFAAQAIAADAIVVFSERGTTARLISKQRPASPIIAFTPYESVRQRMALYWGVRPSVIPQIEHTDDRVEEAERRLKSEGLVTGGEKIVILSGTQVGQSGGTNLMKLHEIR